MNATYDIAIAGAGVLGLAHAYHLARRGLKVVVFERRRRAAGASVRNFGMLWPIGQPPGDLHRLALRSLEIWKEVLRAADLWHDPCGSLHLAYRDDEEQVLREFVAAAGGEYGCSLVGPAEVAARCPAAVRTGLRAGLWSPVEVTVDPRQAIGALPEWLNRTFGVDFRFETTVLDFDPPRVRTSAGDVTAPRLLACTGEDFRDLAAGAFAESGLVACKLQMMRTRAYADRFRVGPMLAAGLTLRHYRAFAACPTLPALARRLDAELPEYGRYGIHILVSQNQAGEVLLGDSHEYGDAVEPFDKPEIDDLVLRQLRTFVVLPDLEIAARWHGVYVKHPTAPYLVADPRPGLRAVAGVGGAGMTLSFGLAEQVAASLG